MNFGDYVVLDYLGSGASGFVYKVEKDSEFYAVKACTNFEPAALRRFDREIRIAKALNHPNIVRVYDYDMNASNPYFSMDLCDGTISKFIKGKDFNELVSMAIDICEGIKALHMASVLHRDIKPDNILIKDGIVKVSDFSFGFFVDHDSATLTKIDQLIGTEGYIAPEVYQLGGHHATVSSDIYSLGCVLWYIFSHGVNPQYYDRRRVNPNVVFLIEKCRENNPADRYANVQEIIDELKALQSPLQFLSVDELLSREKSLSKAEFRNHAYRLLMSKERWDELIHDLIVLKPIRLNDILLNIPYSGSNLILKLENIYHNDNVNWKQYEDSEPFTNLCAQIFNCTRNLLVKQKAIDLSLEFTMAANRWNAMRVIRDDMLAKLKDDEVRSLSGYLKTKKELLSTLEKSIEGSLPSKIKIVAGI